MTKPLVGSVRFYYLYR